MNEPKPWPKNDMPANPLAVMGSNSVPMDVQVVSSFEEDLRSVEGLMDRIKDLQERAAAAGPITSEEMAGRYTDGAKMISQVIKRVEEIREKHNRPILEAQRALTARKNTVIHPLQEAEGKLRSLVSDHLAKERMRVAEENRKREEAARAAREAAQAAAPDVEMDIKPTLVDAPVTRGDYGAKASSRTVWKHKILSVRQLPDAILKNEKVVDALNKVIAAQVKGGARSIKGVEIFSEEETVIR